MWSKNIGLPLSSIGKFAGAIELSLKKMSRFVRVFTMFGNFSAKLFCSQGSLIMSNKQDFESGLQLLLGLLSQVTVASERSFL